VTRQGNIPICAPTQHGSECSSPRHRREDRKRDHDGNVGNIAQPANVFVVMYTDRPIGPTLGRHSDTTRREAKK
jgi:hypothetical protein